LKKWKDEQHLAERSAKKARKATKKRCTEVLRNWIHVAWPTHSNRHKWPGAKWHGLAMPHGTTVPHGTVGPCHLCCYGVFPPVFWHGHTVPLGTAVPIPFRVAT